MIEHNKDIADLMNRFFDRKDVVLIGVRQTNGGDISSILANTNFSELGGADNRLGKKLSQLLHGVVQHYQTSESRLPTRVVSDLEQMGNNFRVLLRNAVHSLTPYDNGGAYDPKLVAATVSQAMLANDLLGLIHMAMKHEVEKSGNESAKDALVAIDNARRPFDHLASRHFDEFMRIANIGRHQENLYRADRQQWANNSASNLPPQVFLPQLTKGRDVLPKTSIINAAGEKHTVQHRYECGTNEKAHDWANSALDKLQREIEAVRQVTPCLLSAFIADGGEFVITQGKTTLYEAHLFHQQADKEYAVAGRNQYIAWKTDKAEGTVAAAIFSCTEYVNARSNPNIKGSVYMAEANIAAHEIAHQGDRYPPPAAMEYGRSEIVGVGYHTRSNLFKICALLDEAFEPNGVAQTVKNEMALTGGYSSNRDEFLGELLPRILENYVSNPASRKIYPIMMAYIENVFLPDMELKAQHAKPQREALKKDMETSFRDVLGPSAPVFERYMTALNAVEADKLAHGDWSDRYMESREKFSIAKSELLQNKAQLQEHITNFISQLSAGPLRAGNRHAHSPRPIAAPL
ncbi:MAG: hypothetical protein PHS57_03935 [Alphaproteobacteria bacterium]|nr:hypothetical protein [Alphaproteobacteria bacterium]